MKSYPVTIGNEFHTENQLSSLKHKLKELKPGEYTIVVVPKKKKRTLPANAYYWGVVLGYIAADTGNDPNALHEHFKRKFNPTVVRIKDEFFIEGGTTADLYSADFGDYMDQVKQWALDFLNVRIPGPNEIPDEYYLELIEKGFIK